MVVSRRDQVEMRPAFAGLGLVLVSDLEILDSISCSSKVSVSLNAISWEDQDLKNIMT